MNAHCALIFLFVSLCSILPKVVDLSADKSSQGAYKVVKEAYDIKWTVYQLLVPRKIQLEYL